MDRPTWASEDIDLDRPSPARMYDYFLGGSHNFAVDRALAEQFIAAVPQTRWMARANRAFLRRAVRYLVDTGVRQFLDLGSGIPTAGNVHEVAQAVAPDARVVYVDLDPIAVAHSGSILAGNANAVAIQADLRHPDAVLARPEVAAMFDLDQPVAVLLLSVLHFVLDADDPAGIIAGYRDALAPGSFLVMSHITVEGQADMATGVQLARRASIPSQVRTRVQVQRLFAGFDLVDPGLVWAPLWRPDSEDPSEHADAPESSSYFVAVGRTP